MAEVDPDLLDSIALIGELGGKMARENCPLADALIREGFAEPCEKLDKFGRRSVRLTWKGTAVLSPGRWLILREGQIVEWADEHLGGPYEATVLARPYNSYPTDPLVIRPFSSGRDREVEVWDFVTSYKWPGWNPNHDLSACTNCGSTGVADNDDGVGPCDVCEGMGYECEDIRILVEPPLTEPGR